MLLPPSASIPTAGCCAKIFINHPESWNHLFDRFDLQTCLLIRLKVVFFCKLVIACHPGFCPHPDAGATPSDGLRQSCRSRFWRFGYGSNPFVDSWISAKRVCSCSARWGMLQLFSDIWYKRIVIPCFASAWMYSKETHSIWFDHRLATSRVTILSSARCGTGSAYNLHRQPALRRVAIECHSHLCKVHFSCIALFRFNVS